MAAPQTTHRCSVRTVSRAEVERTHDAVGNPRRACSGIERTAGRIALPAAGLAICAILDDAVRAGRDLHFAEIRREDLRGGKVARPALSNHFSKASAHAVAPRPRPGSRTPQTPAADGSRLREQAGGFVEPGDIGVHLASRDAGASWGVEPRFKPMRERAAHPLCRVAEVAHRVAQGRCALLIFRKCFHIGVALRVGSS